MCGYVMCVCVCMCMINYKIFKYWISFTSRENKFKKTYKFSYNKRDLREKFR